MKAFAVVVTLVALVAACDLPPQPPAGAQRCGYDWDCPAGESCRFPHVNSYAICMPGQDARWHGGW